MTIESITKRLCKRDPGKRIATSIPKTRIWFSNVPPPAQQHRKVLPAFLKPRPPTSYLVQIQYQKNHTFMNSCLSPPCPRNNYPKTGKLTWHFSATSSRLQPFTLLRLSGSIHRLAKILCNLHYQHQLAPMCYTHRCTINPSSSAILTPMIQFFSISIGPRSGIWVRRCC